MSSIYAAFPTILRELSAGGQVDETLAGAAEQCREHLGFARVVIVAVDGPRLTADRSAALSWPASDVLRRRLLGDGVEITAGSEEADALAGVPHRPGLSSPLAARLGLEDTHAFAAVVYEDVPLALVVADRPSPPVSIDDRAALEGFAGVVAVALRTVVLQTRLHDLSSELRFLTRSAEGLMLDVLEVGTTLPAPGRHRSTFSREDLTAPAPVRLKSTELLTERERAIAEAMAEGRSNREIAAAVHLSPDTVKGYVARILRKLNASNRAEAVARLLQP